MDVKNLSKKDTIFQSKQAFKTSLDFTDNPLFNKK